MPNADEDAEKLHYSHNYCKNVKAAEPLRKTGWHFLTKLNKHMLNI